MLSSRPKNIHVYIYFKCHPNAATTAALSQAMPVAKWDGMVIFEGETYEKIMEVFTSAEYLEIVVPDEKQFLDRDAGQLLALDIATILGN